MTMLARNTDTGLLYRGDTGKLCRGCCFPYPFSEDCCCFLNPSPAAWDDEIIYSLHECVSYSGSNWYSSIDGDNINNEPGVGEGWVGYVSCGNEDWNSVPPYGGIGKTPTYYAISLWITGYAEYNGTGGRYDYANYNMNLILKATVDDDCTHQLYNTSNVADSNISWHVEHINPYSPDYSCDGESDLYYLSGGIGLYHESTGLADILVSTRFYIHYGATDCYDVSALWKNKADAIAGGGAVGGSYPVMPYQYIDACEIVGNRSDTITLTDGAFEQSRTYKISWRPWDCNYTVYDEDENYTISDCVGYEGKFWVCILGNGPDTEAGVQNPSVGGGYWNLVS